MTKILGVDLGNAEVKTSEGVNFPSKVKTGINSMNENDIKVKYNDFDYTVGQGNSNISLNRYKNNNYKVSLLTAIAKSYKEDNIKCNLVVGCPIELFNKNKDVVEDMKKTIKSWGTETIFINDDAKVITIEDVEVFCESGIVFENKSKFENQKTLVIDIGGGTLDISLWNGLNLVDCRSNDKMGMINLYVDIVKEVNRRNNSNLTNDDAKNMIGKTKYKINQEIKDISYIDTIIENFIIGLASDVNQIFPFSNVDSIELIGGGAIALKEYFIDRKMIPKCNVDEDAFKKNAKTYAKVGEFVWS